MNSNRTYNDRKVMLSTLWIFYIFNILYADALNMMGSMATVASAVPDEVVNMLLAPEMLLGAAIFLETAMVMIVLSRLLTYGVNRWVNIIVAILHTAGVSASLFVGTATIYYIFFAIVEIITSIFIVYYAWTWPQPELDSKLLDEMAPAKVT